ncbi:MAG TPA: hypothetical protein GX525_00195 [Bacilli bacterium]|nr:hypothetical protein [Bacilli bacterium]
MRRLIELQQKIVPDLLELMTRRYQILKMINMLEPIGRRNLSMSVSLTERVLRSEVTFLKEQGLLHMSQAGMSLTEIGQRTLLRLEEVMKEELGLKELEEKLKAYLGIEEVIVVAGDSDQFDWVKKEIGKAAVNVMHRQVQADSIVAVTGGTTVAAIADVIPADSALSKATFVPARGGVGELVESQANMICAAIARKVGAQYRMLHVPDRLSEDAYTSLIADPSIQEVLQLIQAANLIIHGIGDAKLMALRRGSNGELMAKLQEQEAVAEAFGYYFDKNGQIIEKERTIGLQLNDLTDSKYVISVAGGAKKAAAIDAYIRYRPSHVLITDEAAANKILGGV